MAMEHFVTEHADAILGSTELFVRCVRLVITHSHNATTVRIFSVTLEGVLTPTSV